MKMLLPVGLAVGIMAGSLPAGGSEVGLVEIKGAIGPATAGYLARAVEVAEAMPAECLVVQLDTPGGLLDSTKDIVQTFYASGVPVVVYVAPSGANAGSAGCFITLAADVAAMAPNTSIGAAHPVAIGGGPQQGADETMSKKLENFAVSYIEAIAQKRGRNIEWAKASVRDSASITAETALETNVIEIIATDLSDLLRQLDGRTINDRTLATAEAGIVPIPMLLRERVFQLIWRPEVMFILMLVAIYGLIGEMSNPGAVLPGVAGAIALVLVLYMAAILPVNIAGVALIVFAVILFVLEAFTPTFGALTTGGVIAFFLGALMLFDSVAPSFRLSLAMIIPATILTAAFFVFVVGAGLRAQRLPVKAGRETLIGRSGEALTDFDAGFGRVLVEGEDWNAACAEPVARGTFVQVTAVEGLTLRVRPAAREENPS